MIHADVAATTRSARPEGKETGDGPPRRHRRSQGRPVAAVPDVEPAPAAREWFALAAYPAPAGYVAWRRQPDGTLTAEPIAVMVTAHLHEVDTLGYRRKGGSLDTRIVPAVFDPEGGVTAVDEAPGFVAVTPAAVTAEEIANRYPAAGAGVDESGHR